MTVLQELLGRFYADSTLNNFSVTDSGGGGAQAITLTAGWYYICGYTGEATNQLCEHMQAQIRALGGVWATATVSYSHTTGYITIAAPGTTSLTITWTDASLQTALGFTGSQTGAKTFTGTQVPRWVWRPSMPLTTYPGNATLIWQPRSTSVVGRAPGGTTRGSVGAATLYDAVLTWELLEEDEVLCPATGTVGGDLESFWGDVVNETAQIRVVVNTASYAAASDFVTAVWGDPDSESVGGFDEYRARELDAYQGLWNVRVPLMKAVS